MPNLKRNLTWGLESQEFDNLLPEHWKVSKLGLWWEAFIQSRKCMRLNFTEELSIKITEKNVKIEENLTCRFKIDTTIWLILTRALECLKNVPFNGLLLTKVYSVWANKSFFLMAVKIDAKFEGKLICTLENDTRNLVNFHR